MTLSSITLGCIEALQKKKSAFLKTGVTGNVPVWGFEIYLGIQAHKNVSTLTGLNPKRQKSIPKRLFHTSWQNIPYLLLLLNEDMVL